VSERLTDNTKLSGRLQSLLPAGTNVQTAAAGFKNRASSKRIVPDSFASASSSIPGNAVIYVYFSQSNSPRIPVWIGR
jgi:hypothetical protein